jgi:hypothetical protein
MSNKKLQEDGVTFVRLAYADLLKQEAADATGIPISNFYDRKVKEHYRPLLQWWGTEYRRNEAIGGDNAYWTKSHGKRCREIYDKHVLTRPNDKLVILVPDVRFDNEALDVDYVIQVNAINQQGVVANSNHVSESGVSNDLIHKHIHVDHSAGVGYDVDMIRGIVWDALEERK